VSDDLARAAEDRALFEQPRRSIDRMLLAIAGAGILALIAIAIGGILP
jgi:hypothetical protein